MFRRRFAALFAVVLAGCTAGASELPLGELRLACERDHPVLDAVLLPYEPLECGGGAPEHVTFHLLSRDLAPGAVFRVPADARAQRCLAHEPCVRADAGELEVLALAADRAEVAWSLALPGGARVDGVSVLVVCGPPPGDPGCVVTCEPRCSPGP